MNNLQIYKGGVIKIPPLIFNEVKFYRLCFFMFVGILLMSGRSSQVSVENMPNNNGVIPLIMSADSLRGTVKEVVKPSKKEVRESLKILEKQPNSQVKRIAITDIVKDPKYLNFICHNEVLKRAIQVSDSTGLSIAVIIAQKAVESNCNGSRLTDKTNNLGNIKCKCTWNKKLRKQHETMDVCVRAWDKREKSNHWYVKLQTKWEGWVLYKNLIKRRYKKVNNIESYQEQIAYLKKKGYATMPRYDEIIIKVIKNNKLDILEDYLNNGFSITTSNGKYILN